MTINSVLASELQVLPEQINAAVSLLDDGATVPFIARYRKEATNGLDDIQLRLLQQRLTYLRELADRKRVILKSIADQGKMTDALKTLINAVESKTELEDLYLPFKPKRRTKGQIAIEAGLEPLANSLLTNPELVPESEAEQFIDSDKGIADSKAALDGAKFILMERFAEDAALLSKIRSSLNKYAVMRSEVNPDKQKEAVKYKDYFEHQEPLNAVPSHRALAMFRGRNEGFLFIHLDSEVDKALGDEKIARTIADHFGIEQKQRPADDWLNQVAKWTWKVKLSLHMETELFGALRERAEQEAINVFASNLKDLLLAAPAGAKVTMGLDPGLRTGVKVAIVDATGKVIDTHTIYPHAPQNQWDKSLRTLASLCAQHKVEIISIGNGTGSRETDKLVSELIGSQTDKRITKVMVSEAGASVYSASELASQELGEMDVSLRGAVSIARRLQDPLAELVKIEPKAIGVGQYQHDVNQSQLGQQLDKVIEDCVNAVGVDVNIASPSLLSYVSGLNKTLAQNIVRYRDQNGSFNNRKTLKKVDRLGPKAFEQAAGFLRIRGGDNPLDASSVHPESYPLVDKIIAHTQSSIDALMGNSAALKQLSASEFSDSDYGLLTIKDIFTELEKPGRDPRPEFKTAQFKEGVNTISDLREGMLLEGVVSNVANFGAFVDVGVHQDGLVHISALTNKFIKDPREVVKAGDIVKVKVLEVDIERKRIAFTMRLDEASQPPARKPKAKSKTKANPPKATNSAMGSAFADAFAKAKKNK